MRYSLLLFLTLLWIPIAPGEIQEIDPPEILAPDDNAVINGPKLTVRWAPLQEGQWCQIQIAPDPDFNEILVNVDKLHGDTWTCAQLPQDGKRYYWRICAWQEIDESPEGENSLEGEDSYHPADTNSDRRLEFSEADDYRKGWQTGNHTMIDAIRALFIQKRGEYYHNPDPSKPQWWVPLED